VFSIQGCKRPPAKREFDPRFHWMKSEFCSRPNTVKGVGKDIERAGEAIQRTAKP